MFYGKLVFVANTTSHMDPIYGYFTNLKKFSEKKVSKTTNVFKANPRRNDQPGKGDWNLATENWFRMSQEVSNWLVNGL